jgi:hypothetical protein
MKKILLISALLGLIFHTGSIAQTFETQNGDTSFVSWNGGSVLKVYNRIKSTGNAPVTLRWRVLNPSSAVASGWNLGGIYDNNGSHSLDNGWKEINVSPGNNWDPAAHDFHVRFEDMSTAPNGTSVFQIQVQDAANPNSQKTLTFIASKSAAGVSSLSRSDDDVVVYPNPARGFVNVHFSPDAGVKNIALYNLIGKPVMVYRVQGNSSARLELESVPSGVYFLRLLDTQGRVMATRRFTHQ